MKKILLIATGGTIASGKTPAGMNPQLAPAELLEMVPQHAAFCQVDYKQLLNLDSTNVQPEHWQLMARECSEALDTYDGIVISHGTDTLSYTASALSFMLQNLNKPVIVTGSQKTISDPTGDARDNLLQSLLAASSELAGVFAVFHGKVILGSHTVKICTHSFDAFASINAPLAAYIEDGELIIPPDSLAKKKTGNNDFRLVDSLDPKVMLIRLIPGFEPEWLRQIALLDIHGIVIEAYGYGGLPFCGRDLLSVVKELLAQNIAVALGTQVLYEKTDLSVYEVAVKARDAGVISTGIMTSEAVVTKLMWALGQSRDLEEIRKIMNQDIALETQGWQGS